MTDAVRCTAAQARELAADPRWPETLVDAPALVLDLRDDLPGAQPVSFSRAPCPAVAVVPPGVESDWVVDLALVQGSADLDLLGGTVDAAVDVLVAAATANPGAAATLAQVLRVSPQLPVDEALVIESLGYSMLLAGREFREWLTSFGRPRERQEEPGSAVVAERSGGVLRLMLNRPHVHNAFNAAMRDGLVDALTVALADWSVGTIELTGIGPSFCSGGDLAEFGTADDPVHAHRVRTTRSAGAAMHALRDRLTVRVHGSCIGAGVELPAFARRVIAARDATFRLPEVGMGLIPGAGGTVSLPRRIGAARTLLLALSGRPLTADLALTWGLVDAIE